MKRTLLAILLSLTIATAGVAFLPEVGSTSVEESYGVYVTANGTVIKLAPDGTELMRIPKEKLGLPECLRGGTAIGLAINQSDGTIWVWSAGWADPPCTSYMSALSHLSADGEEILSSWTMTEAWVKSIEVDPTDGSVYVSSDYDPYTFKYSADGTLLYTLTSSAAHWWAQVAINTAEQTVWMTDYQAGKVLKLGSDGSEILSLSGFAPTGISIDQTDGSVWVADRGHNEVVKLDSAGNELVRVSVGSSPFWIAANPADGGAWMVFHPGPGPVVRVDSDGNVIATSPTFKFAEGELDIARDGTVWVAETLAHKLHKLSPTGDVLLTVGGDPATFHEPKWAMVLPNWTIVAPTEEGACFIATAAYGTSTAKELDTLRVFRDEVLLQNSLGSTFVDLYYAVSPPLADFISEHEPLRILVKDLLVDPAAWVVEATEVVWRD